MSRAKTLSPAQAVHKHERVMHKGQPLTPMKTGGRVGDTIMRGKKIAMNAGSPKRPVASSGSPMAKGGRACMAIGGAAKVRKGVATSSGAPKGGSKSKGLI